MFTSRDEVRDYYASLRVQEVVADHESDDPEVAPAVQPDDAEVPLAMAGK